VKEGAPRERTSRVTFDLEPSGKVVRLTVTHDELDERGETLRSISQGWPMVLASLKSILETGHALDIDPSAAKEPARAQARIRPRHLYRDHAGTTVAGADR